MGVNPLAALGIERRDFLSVVISSLLYSLRLDQANTPGDGREVGVAQNSNARVTQVLVFVSIYEGASLCTILCFTAK